MADESQFNVENVFMKKYLALRNKCEQLQQSNEKLINRLQHVQKLVRKYNREKKFLQARLDRYNDNYQEAQVPVMWEEDQMYNLLKPKVEPLSLGESPVPLHQPTTKSKHVKKIKSLLTSPKQQSPSQLTASQSQDSMMSSMTSSSVVVGGLQQRDAYSGLGTFDTPKRPTNAFLMFCDQYQQSVRNEYFRERNAIISQSELTKRLAVKWGTLSHEDKKTYQDMFEIQRRQLQSDGNSKAVDTIYQETDTAVSAILSASDPT